MDPPQQQQAETPTDDLVNDESLNNDQSPSAPTLGDNVSNFATEDTNITTQQDAPGDAEMIAQQDAPMIDLEEIDRLAKDDPFNAFALIAKSNTLFSTSTGQTSDSSKGNPSETSKNNLLAEFQKKIIEANLLELIEKDAGALAEIKSLFEKLGALPTGWKFRNLFNYLEPMLESANQNFQKRKTGQAQMAEKKAHHDQIVIELSSFQEKFKTLQQERNNAKQQVVDIDAKIKELEAQKAEILAKDEARNREANEAVNKFKLSKELESTIAQLANDNHALDTQLAEYKSQIEKLISSFEI